MADELLGLIGVVVGTPIAVAAFIYRKFSHGLDSVYGTRRRLTHVSSVGLYSAESMCEHMNHAYPDNTLLKRSMEDLIADRCESFSLSVDTQPKETVVTCRRMDRKLFECRSHSDAW